MREPACLQEHLPTKPCESSAFTNIRRKSNILVYGFSPAKPILSNSDPCQAPSCPHHLPQSTTWPPSRLTFLQSSDLGKSSSTGLEHPCSFYKISTDFFKTMLNPNPSMKLPFFSEYELNICPLAREVVC